MESILSTIDKYRVHFTEDVKLGDRTVEEFWYNEFDSFDDALECYDRRCNIKNYHDVRLEKIETKTVEVKTVLKKQEICTEGEVVFAIIKNFKTWQIEVAQTTVLKVDENEIVLEGETRGSVTDLYTFPKSEWKKSIFYSFNEAQDELRCR